MRKSLLRWIPSLLLACLAMAQENGKLQIHFMDVGQGDGAILISPKGQTVLIDNGVKDDCDRPVAYLQQLGVARIDYHIASHYHADHIGCTAQVFREFPLQLAAFDRGGSYSSATFTSYIEQMGAKRKTAGPGAPILLDNGSTTPVRVEFIALNGNGVPPRNENDMSVVAVVRFGSFDAVFGGDLSGEDTSRYRDVETSVASLAGQVEVYKVNHHGSEHSSNIAWLSTIKPIVGIISTGNGNSYGHPTQAALDRLHDAGVKTYWTERGNGTTPVPGSDMVGGDIRVEVAPGATNFTVTHNGASVDTYPMWGSSPGTPPAGPRFSWSRRSSVYHLTTCRYVSSISPDNLQSGSAAPSGKTLHQGCPR